MIPKELCRFRINDDPYEVAVSPYQTLLETLRETVGLTGTKRGCDDASCGACTVLVDGRPTLSCIQLALTIEDSDVLTIEGVSGNATLEAIERAIVEEGGSQCGYCTPGIVLAVHAMLRQRSQDPNRHPDESAIRVGLSGNLCRCTGYVRIVDAVKRLTK